MTVNNLKTVELSLREEAETESFISIVVPTFRRPDALTQTLTALLALDYPSESYEIIIVDDGSGDTTPEVVERFQKEHRRVLYLPQPNSGVATARNNGARQAKGEILIFVDDDIIVQPSLIRQHLATLGRFEPCLVNGHWEFEPKLKAALAKTPFGRYRIQIENWVKEGLPKEALLEDARAKDQSLEMHSSDRCVSPEAMTACNLCISREDFWRIGGFDEDFPFAGYEDQEFSLRAKKLGYHFVYNYDLQFLHNDHRLTLRQFCERQRRGATTAALLALKYPQQYAEKSLVLENNLLTLKDPPRFIIKKLIKRVLSTPLALTLLYGVERFLERTTPRSPLLNKLYWTMCGLYIFRGFREGLKRYGSS